jgi:NAD(P)-dependent dehydrogenase (short-subunit alcohol dehydrogenase family)
MLNNGKHESRNSAPAALSDGRLDGRVAVITGGAGGIGVAIARRFGANGAGVVLADINADAAEKAAALLVAEGHNVSALPSDVSTAAACARLIDDVLDESGQIDILVNNAGYMGKLAPIWDQTDADWQNVLDVDLSSVFYTSRAAISGMRARRSGCIVNIASIAGKEGTPNLIPYSVAKAGIIALTKALGKEVVGDGIRVNCVAPGVIETPLLDQLTQESVDKMRGKSPMGRFGTADEVAAVVHFLASDSASYVTAQCYDVSGGRATY